MEWIADRRLDEFDRFTAGVTDQVQVKMILGLVIAHRAVGLVDVAHHAELFKHLKRVGDGRPVHHR